MLNNLLKVLTPKIQIIDPRRTHCIRYSLPMPCPSASPFLPIDICRSKSHQEPLYRTGSFRVSETGDFGTLIWPHFGRLIWPHLTYSDRSSYPVPASRDGEGDGQETQGGTV